MESGVVYIDNNTLYFVCPHCAAGIEVFISDVNCKIFRHAYLKCNKQQINPHTPKNVCDELVKRDLVIGCAKPFRLVINSGKIIVEKCNYI